MKKHYLMQLLSFLSPDQSSLSSHVGCPPIHVSTTSKTPQAAACLAS